MRDETLTEILARRNLTYRDLSRLTGIHYTLWFKWRNGERSPSVPLIRLIALTLGLKEDRVRRAIVRETAKARS